MGLFSSKRSNSSNTKRPANTGAATRSAGDSSSLSDESQGRRTGRENPSPNKKPLSPVQEQQLKHEKQQQAASRPSTTGTGQPPTITIPRRTSPPTQQNNTPHRPSTTTTQKQPPPGSAVQALQRDASSNASSTRGMIRSQRLSISVTATPLENAESVKAQINDSKTITSQPAWESEDSRQKFREGLNLMRTLYTWDQVPLDFFVDEQVEERSAFSRLSVSLTQLPRSQSKKPVVPVATPVAAQPPKAPESPSARARRASVATSNPVVIPEGKLPNNIVVGGNGRKTTGPANVAARPNTNKQVEVAIAMESRPRRHSATSVEHVYVRLAQNDDRLFQVNNPLRTEKTIGEDSNSNVEEKQTSPMSSTADMSSQHSAHSSVRVDQFNAYRRSVDFTDPRRTSVVHRKSVAQSSQVPPSMVAVTVPRGILSDDDVDNML